MTGLYQRNFAIAFVAQTLFVLATTLLLHYARWISFLGGDERDIGLVMGLGPIVGLLLRPWLGQWIDRLGPRAGCALGCATLAICALGK